MNPQFMRMLMAWNSGFRPQGEGYSPEQMFQGLGSMLGPGGGGQGSAGSAWAGRPYGDAFMRGGSPDLDFMGAVSQNLDLNNWMNAGFKGTPNEGQRFSPGNVSRFQGGDTFGSSGLFGSGWGARR